ncbi:MAG: hypothetical protein FWC32_06735 [Firmicutes bacterium]|nr:hypothetical protein [Bacillota bacterium]
MIFDRNQKDFPSEFCRDIWWWAVGIVPLSVSLPDEVKSKCTPEIIEGCHQWHAYFNELCADMYSHENEYLPATPRQYRDILEYISANGRLTGDSMVFDTDIWEAHRAKINRSKAYVTAGMSLEQCLRVLERTGLKCEKTENAVIFSHSKYPKIFHAMHTMEQSPEIRQTPARHHFAHCEFRRLFKNYAENYDELLRRVSDESLRIAHAIHDYCKLLKIQRYIHFGIIKYKYKGTRVLDFSLHKDEYPTLRVNIGTGVNTDMDSKIRIHPHEKDLEEILALIAARKVAIDQS